MSTIVYDPLEATDLADEDAFNSRFGQLATKLNTGLDTDNLLAGAATRAKIGQGAVTQAKMNNTFSWITPTLVTGWSHWSDATYDGARYYKDARGTVRMRGLVNRTSGSSTTIFNLPVGYRPTKRLIFMVASEGGGSRIDVDTTGDVIWITGANIAGYQSLANIHFRAVQ